MWLELDKQLLKSDTKVVVGIVYVPPEGSLYANDDAFNIINQERIDLFHDVDNIFMIGDFNARTHTHADYVHLDDFESTHFEDDPFIAYYMSSVEKCMKQHNLQQNRISQDKARPTNYGNKLIDFCKNNNFVILNGRCGTDKNIGNTTCKNSSVVDYVLMYTEMQLYVKNFYVNEFSVLLSDVHCPISVIIENKRVLDPYHNYVDDTTTNKSTVDPNIIDNTITGRTVPKQWEKEKINDYVNELKQHDITSILNELASIKEGIGQETKDITQARLDKITMLITENLTQAAKNTNGTKIIKNNPNHRTHTDNHNTIKDNKEWFDDSCKEKRETYHRIKKSHNTNEAENSYANVQEASRSYKKTMNIAISKYKTKKQNELKRLRTADSKSFWNKFTKRKKKEYQPINKLYQHFKVNIVTDNEHTQLPHPPTAHVPTENDDIILNGCIEDKEITDAMRRLKNDKSPGDDYILNEYLTSSTNIYLPVYNAHFNIALDAGCFPDEWTTGVISPLYKGKGDKNDATNYRPITLLSCFGKLFTSILNERLTRFLDKNNILHENQAGFRHNYSTNDHILTLHLLLEYMTFKKKTLYCGFMDLKQAYDLVNRAQLFQKLELFNVKGKFFNVLLSMYSHTKSRLKCNNLYTKPFPCDVGIRQGENLSCMMFAIFLNDLEMFIEGQRCNHLMLTDNNDMHVFVKLFILLYADDTVLLANNPTDFQNMLNAYALYLPNGISDRKHQNTAGCSRSKILLHGGRMECA